MLDTAPTAPPPLRVTGGLVQGTAEGGVFAFRGVPFAAPIAGANRWRAPQPVAVWDGVRPADRYGEVCPQPRFGGGFTGAFVRLKATGRAFAGAITDLGGPPGDACLNLNIWTPSLDRAAKLSVLVFIHGGSFTAGAGSSPIYDGGALARAGLVLVTINYRLGVMGFLGGDGLFPDGLGIANRGFLDQIAALSWVAENIASFGGDPDQVTVCGESAGATSVIMLAASPAVAGLAHRFIAMSGAPIAYPQAECAALAADWFAALGVKSGDGAALGALGAAEVLAAPGPNALLRRRRDRYGALGADGMAWQVPALGTELFPTSTIEAIAAKPGLSLMLGTCRDEARLWGIFLPIPADWASRMMFAFHAPLLNPKGQPQAAFRAYRARMPKASAREVRERAMTDALFRRPTVAVAEAAAKAPNGDCFLWRFDWASPALGGAFGACHAIDLPGLFQSYAIFAPFVGPEAAARPAGDALHHAIVSFAKTGAPAIPGGPDWPAYDPARRPTMIIDGTCAVRDDLDAGFADIW